MRLTSCKGASFKGCSLRDANLAATDLEVREGKSLQYRLMSLLYYTHVHTRMCTQNTHTHTHTHNTHTHAPLISLSPLPPSSLQSCDFTGSDLHDTNLRGANLKDTNFENISGPGLHMSQTLNLTGGQGGRYRNAERENLI